MNTIRCFFMIFTFMALQAMAQNQELSLLTTYDNYIFQKQSNEPQDTKSNKIPLSWFIREASFVDYFFKQERAFYTPGIASGLIVNYKKSTFEIGTFINKVDYWGSFMLFGYTLDAKNLDENWIRIITCFGEIAYLPQQQSSSDLWIYTTGMAFILARPFKWGIPCMAFTFGAAYSDEEINLNTRALVNLSIPIF